MTIKKDPFVIDAKLLRASKEIEEVIADYLQDYADYGWDSFTETLANLTAQIYMQRVILDNAVVKKDSYR